MLEFKIFLLIFCLLTVVLGQECRDENYLCQFWANGGKCENEWMVLNCQLSCGICNSQNATVSDIFIAGIENTERERNKRIENGRIARNASFVAYFFSNNNKTICTASAIGDHCLITSYHCISALKTYDSYSIFLGSKIIGRGIELTLNNILPSPFFFPLKAAKPNGTNEINYDITLMVVNEHIEDSNMIKISDVEFKAGRTGKLYGAGLVKNCTTEPKYIQEVEVTVREVVTENYTNIFYTTGINCKADSGGLLVFSENAENYLGGITYGMYGGNSTFIKISKFYNWIMGAMNFTKTSLDYYKRFKDFN